MTARASNKYLFFLSLLITTHIHAQTPHITGDVYISIKDGTFKADLDISRLPKTTNYSIWLNSGFNIRSFRDSTDKFSYAAEKNYDGDKAYESFQYWFPSSNNKTRYLPKRFKISYVGTFPVYSTVDSAKRSDYGDWKGNIAFNGKTLRASEQTAWYPVLYDTLEDKRYQNVTFDITIHAPDARAIYMNGCPPQYGQQLRFQSEKPFPLMIFAGDFDFVKERNTYLVNTTLTKIQANILDSWLSRIKDYYQKNLQIPYGTDITLLASTPVTRRNSWLFVTYPTIASISPNGMLNRLVDDKKQALSDSSLLSFIAHELGHYYFGSYISPNSTLRWAFLEGMTEYLSLQVTRDLLGKRFYDKKIKDYIEANKGLKIFIPLKNIKNPSDINETYRYQYIPLLLTALEQKIGREQMWKWLRIILNTKSPTTNYEFFRSTLLSSGIDEKIVTNFESSYLTTDKGLQNLLSLPY